MPSDHSAHPLSRRSLLKALLPLSAAPLLGARLGAQDDFRFIVVNDLHHGSAECDPFFAQLVRQMSTHGPLDLCLIVGDIADVGKPESLVAVRDAFAALKVPVYTVPGNHDCDIEKTTRLYSEVFPGRLNYGFRHKGWQFIGLDTTEGEKWQNTRISADTFAWLDETMPSLDPSTPTVLFTHFPLAPGVNLVPLNAPELVTRIERLNVTGAFTGHYHARVERRSGDTPLVTNACCSRMRDNHDNSLEEGYLLCSAQADGSLSWEFVEFVPARKASA